MPFFTLFTLFVWNVCKLWNTTNRKLCEIDASKAESVDNTKSYTNKSSKMSRPSKIMKLVKDIKPTRMWIDGKSFYITNDQKNYIYESQNCIEEYKVHFNIDYNNDLYHSKFYLPRVYYEELHNFSHFTIKELEEHTSTNINVPQISDEPIVISSTCITNVIDARHKLHSVFSVIRESQNVLQFISIPVATDDIKRKFENFKKEILNIEKMDGMHESIFQKPERLHLTVAVFSLFSDAEKLEAVSALNECKAKIIDPILAESGQLHIKVAGLDCMNNNYKKANILYANAKICTDKNEDILQPIANSIAKHFYEKGFVRQYQENVKIHITLINTKYRKTESRKRRWKDKRKPFDATQIMEKYKDYHFGECALNEIHLSWIAKVDDNGFYKPLSIITIYFFIYSSKRGLHLL